MLELALGFASLVVLVTAIGHPPTYNVPSNPTTSGQPFDGFVSYSIEFSSFPDYAGNLTHPNRFSYNLVQNLRSIGGAYPLIRVGGNTQDYALYNASQREALIGTIDPVVSPNYPSKVRIGNAFFESYRTWPGVRFSHGFNMGLGAKTTEGWSTLVDTVPLVCEALSHNNLYTWEYSNEPDSFSQNDDKTRPKTWTVNDMVREWLHGTSEITKQVQRHCPALAKNKVQFMAPSNAGFDNPLTAPQMWAAGLDTNNNIELFSTHLYVSGAKVAGVTLQNTLMNFTRTKSLVDKHIKEYIDIFGEAPSVARRKKHSLPIIFGEANSLYNQGRPGVSNTFGAALWTVNFNLYSASVNIQRVHMHLGTNFWYQAWQPISTVRDTIGTKPPYYASIAAAAMTKRANHNPVAISNVPMSSDPAECAYAAHVGTGAEKKLVRLMVINMHGYNTTVDGAGLVPLPRPARRPVRAYHFRLEGVRDSTRVSIHRLMANGSDAITGITYDGWSYNYDLDNGRPVRLKNVTVGETISVRNGKISVRVADSSAVILNFE